MMAIVVKSDEGVQCHPTAYQVIVVGNMIGSAMQARVEAEKGCPL